MLPPMSAPSPVPSLAITFSNPQEDVNCLSCLVLYTTNNNSNNSALLTRSSVLLLLFAWLAQGLTHPSLLCLVRSSIRHHQASSNTSLGVRLRMLLLSWPGVGSFNTTAWTREEKKPSQPSSSSQQHHHHHHHHINARSKRKRRRRKRKKSRKINKKGKTQITTTFATRTQSIPVTRSTSILY